MKKILSILLAVVMIMSLGSISFADFRGPVDGIEMSPGFNPVARVSENTFDYVIYARDMSGMKNGDLIVMYDTSILTLLEVKQVGNYTNSVYNDIGGEVYFSYLYSDENTSHAVKMYILTFSYSKSGVYPEIEVTNINGTFIKSVKDITVVKATDENAAISSGKDIDDSYMQDDEDYFKGDVNGDEKITAADARRILRIAANLEIVYLDEYLIADFNGDGNVTPSDARLVLRKAAKLD